MNKLEGAFKQAYKEMINENTIVATANFMELDEQGVEELISLSESEKLIEELYLNTVHIYLNDDELTEYKKLWVDIYNIKKEAEEKIALLSGKLSQMTEPFKQEVEEKSNNITSDFFSRMNKEISKIVTDSVERTEYVGE